MSAKLQPLLVGRLTRILFGIGAFVLIPAVGPSALTPWGTAVTKLGLPRKTCLRERTFAP